MSVVFSNNKHVLNLLRTDSDWQWVLVLVFDSYSCQKKKRVETSVDWFDKPWVTWLISNYYQNVSLDI